MIIAMMNDYVKRDYCQSIFIYLRLFKKNFLLLRLKL